MLTDVSGLNWMPCPPRDSTGAIKLSLIHLAVRAAGQYVGALYMPEISGASGANSMVDYQAGLRPVIRALEQNPDLSIEMLASSACLSFYHFQGGLRP